MAGKREQIAHWIDRIGAADLILGLRRRLPSRIPTPVLTVLTYHSVGDPPADYPFDPDVIDATPQQFAAQLQHLGRHFTFVGIDDVYAAVVGGAPLPPNPLLITFDDGYLSCLQVALPLLQQAGARATFFIATDFVARRKLYWWDRINYVVRRCQRPSIELAYPDRASLPTDRPQQAIHTLLRLVKDRAGLDVDRLLDELTEAAGIPWSEQHEHELADQLIMTWDQVRALRDAGMDIQSHTRRHRVLQTLSSEQLTDELSGSRTDLERELGAPVRTVAYPVGHAIANDPAIRGALTSAGYKLGFSNANGVNYLWGRMDPFDIRRIAADRTQTMAMFRTQLAIPQLSY